MDMPRLIQQIVIHLVDTGHTYSTEDNLPIRLRPSEAFKLVTDILDYLEGEGYEIKNKTNS